jgi:hypothetical protein
VCLVVEWNGFHLAPVPLFGWVGEVNQVVPQKGIYPPDTECTRSAKTVELLKQVADHYRIEPKILSSSDRAKPSLLSPIRSFIPLCVSLSRASPLTSGQHSLAGQRPRIRRGGGYCMRAKRRWWQQLHAGKSVG